MQGCGCRMVQFCTASVLATLVLDDYAMDLVNERNECHLIFECCLSLLASTLQSLKLKDSPQTPEADADEAAADKALSVRLAEGCAQALWGSAYYCALKTPEAIQLKHILQLSEIGLECVKNQMVCIHKLMFALQKYLAKCDGLVLHRFHWAVLPTA